MTYTKSDTTPQGIKYDGDKPRMELLPPIALLEISKVLTFGANKYEPWNWAKGLKWTRLLGACLRHVTLWSMGEDKDKETGLSHIAHAACCLMFLLHLEQTRKDLDDRHKTTKNNEENNG
jgi:hypothetical protein